MPPLENARHEKFCQAMLTGMSMGDAVREAGYHIKEPNNYGYRLARIPAVAARRRELQGDSASDTVKSVIERKGRLCQIAWDKDARHSDAIAAIAELNKMEGIYLPAKSETENISIEIKTIIVHTSREHPEYQALPPAP